MTTSASNQLQFILNERYNALQKGESALPRTKNLKPSQKQAAPGTIILRKRPKDGYTYISPFIKKANEIAKARAKTAIGKIREHRAIINENESMKFITTPGLFDPRIKKKEIFRLEPRHRQMEISRRGSDGGRPGGDSDTNREESSLMSDTEKYKHVTSMTRRTQEVNYYARTFTVYVPLNILRDMYVFIRISLVALQGRQFSPRLIYLRPL
jgi:hypothetical protein